MRALTLALALAASAAAGPAMATIFVFNTSMNGANEAIPNASPGAGFSELFFDTDLHTLRVTASFQDLVAPTTAAHVHAPTTEPNEGAAGVATQLPSFDGFPLNVTFGDFDNTFDMTLASSWNPGFVTANGGTTAGAEAALLAALLEERAYFNIHTTSFPAGEIRGFYDLVPEPGTWALMIAGFGLAGAALRRRAPAPAVTLTS